MSVNRPKLELFWSDLRSFHYADILHVRSTNYLLSGDTVEEMIIFSRWFMELAECM
jgi:hypothetical protein